MWFVFAVFVLILGDQELSENFPGKSKAIELIKKLKSARQPNNVMVTTTSFSQNQALDETTLQ